VVPVAVIEKDAGLYLDEPTPAQVRVRLRASRVVPSVLTVPCATHAASVGELCYRHAPGVCWVRVVARAARRSAGQK